MAGGGKQNDMKRRPIRRQVQRMVFLLCVAALVVTGVLWAGSLFALRDTVQRDSQDLGESAASAGGEALLSQMEQNLYQGVRSEAAVVDEKLERYAADVRDFAFYAGRLYEEPDAYVPKEVLPPDAASRYTFTMQLVWRDGDTDRAAVQEEIGLLANLVHIWQPVMTGDTENIASIYLCTESGFMINYDERSDLTPEYFDYEQSAWYQAARDTGDVIFTVPYMDTFGRGLMLTCAAPIHDADGRFAGVVCMDMMVEDLVEKVLDIDFSEGSYGFLVDGTGNIIVSPQMEYAGTFENVRDPNCLAREAAESIMSDEAGVTPTSGGLYYAYTPIDAANRTLAVHMPADMITAPAEGIRTDITERTESTAGTIDRNIAQTGFISLAVFVVIIGAVVALSGGFSRKLTEPLLELRSDVEHISGGDLDHQAAVRRNDEIGDLAAAFNGMAGSLDRYIKDLTAVTAEKERIGAELDIATHIQASMLPCLFPAFPNRREFDVYASMTPAKEVGGDFYDFFMLDDTHLAVVVADVSGKGVPAALFMVIGKTLIKDHTTPNRDLGEVFMEVNRLLCEGNSEEMFITAFEGVLNLETGRFDFVNAGHETPFICRKGEGYAPYKIRPGFVLAGMEGTRYRMGSLQLEPGDKLFQYTDGVTEATNSRSELYGMERLTAVLNRNAYAKPDDLLPKVKADIDAFVGGAPQFDDITMLCLEFKERTRASYPREITVEAAAENIPAVTAFVDGKPETLDCPAKAKAQIDVAIDELFGNIARYAYDTSGPVTVRVETGREPKAVRATFIDRGKPYDPLAKPDPDVTLSAEERPIGGLGIFMVKKSMDDVRYEYRDGRNILTVEKRLRDTSGKEKNHSGG